MGVFVQFGRVGRVSFPTWCHFHRSLGLEEHFFASSDDPGNSHSASLQVVSKGVLNPCQTSWAFPSRPFQGQFGPPCDRKDVGDWGCCVGVTDSNPQPLLGQESNLRRHHLYIKRCFRVHEFVLNHVGQALLAAAAELLDAPGRGVWRDSLVFRDV